MKKWITSRFNRKNKSSNIPQKDENPTHSPASKWIGVDLDGTLAEYTEWKGIEKIGSPIPLMKKRVLEWINQGYTIKIFTARTSQPRGTQHVQNWLVKNGFPKLEVTNQKDFDMIELWDDRAIQVIPNTGIAIIRPSITTFPQAPFSKSEEAGETYHIVKHLNNKSPNPPSP